MFKNLFSSATTTPIEIDVSGKVSITPFLFFTSKYPFSASSSLKYFKTSISNSAIMS